MTVGTDRTTPGESELDALVGTPFPGGEVTLEPWWVHLVLDSLLADPDDGGAHPVLVFLVATGAMGWTWDELFALCGATEADGPMAGETDTVVHHPLQVGGTYRVSGEIVSTVRKVGRRTGTFDIVGYRLDLHDGNGVHHASTTNSIVFPRRGDSS
ncbi:hypothetical protein LRS71_16705 [Rhodococcus pyridinivorans]|uniref:hypothetical protein n=1 Tax=Rhodococcus pyridinivorans TaxID=103816 RepID=UPI000BA24C17|nr:hypothetical protein [Rhodococcus pyridinivorans]MCD5421177.1 hypothetical protein [Rhodococcus pyridinivorans]